MNKELQLRGGLAITLILLIIISFYYLKQSDELKKCQTDTYSISGGDIYRGEIERQLDSLRSNIFILENLNNRFEIGISLYLDEEAHIRMKNDRDLVSSFTKNERNEGVEKIKKLKINYDYPYCSWVISYEVFRKENPKMAEEIDEFISHLTE